LCTDDDLNRHILGIRECEMTCGLKAVVRERPKQPGVSGCKAFDKTFFRKSVGKN
jgi:hypothetical protein